MNSDKDKTMNTLEIKKMSTIEQLHAMEALWESLIEEESNIVSPSWHEDVLEKERKTGER